MVGKRPGHLTLSWAGCAQKIFPMQLWTREQLGRVWLEDARRRWRPSPSSSEELAEKIGVSDPEVADSFEDEQNVWVAIRFYDGEGFGGGRHDHPTQQIFMHGKSPPASTAFPLFHFTHRRRG